MIVLGFKFDSSEFSRNGHAGEAWTEQGSSILLPGQESVPSVQTVLEKLSYKSE